MGSRRGAVSKNRGGPSCNQKSSPGLGERGGELLYNRTGVGKRATLKKWNPLFDDLER